MSSAFLIKLRVVYYRDAALLRHLSTIYFFLKKRHFFLFILLKTSSFCYIFQKKKIICGEFFIEKLQSEHCRLATSLEEIPSYKFSSEVSKLSQSIIFSNILICAKETNYIKDYRKTRP